MLYRLPSGEWLTLRDVCGITVCERSYPPEDAGKWDVCLIAVIGKQKPDDMGCETYFRVRFDGEAPAKDFADQMAKLVNEAQMEVIPVLPGFVE